MWKGFIYIFTQQNCPSVVVISITTNIFATNKFDSVCFTEEAKLLVKSMLDMWCEHVICEEHNYGEYKHNFLMCFISDQALQKLAIVFVCWCVCICVVLVNCRLCGQNVQWCVCVCGCIQKCCKCNFHHCYLHHRIQLNTKHNC